MHKITNQFQLPSSIFKALSEDGYKAGNSDISVTSLIAPPKATELKRRHEAELTEDASQRVWSLLGQSMHTIVEKAATESCIAEKRLYVEVDGWTIGGMTDLYEKDGTVSDFKCTSSFSFLLGEKFEWAAQLNVNAALWKKAGYKVTKLQIIAILRDWIGSKAANDPSYPQCAIIIVPIKMWSDAETLKYMQERVALHKAAREAKKDDDIPVCTPEERWHRDDSWAIIKGKNKRATKVCSSAEEAEAWTAKQDVKLGYHIQERKGKDTRCLSFCLARPFCNHGRTLIATEEEVPE